MKIINKYFFTLIFFSILGGQLYSQQSKIDSLLILIKRAKEDTNKVNHLNALGAELMYSNPDTAIILSNQALVIASGTKLSAEWKKGVANSIGQLGSYYLCKSEYRRALDYYQRALKVDEELNYKKGIGTRLGNIGIVFMYQANYPKALDYYFKALNIGDELDDKKSIASNLSNIGSVYTFQADYPKALEYFFKTLKIDEVRGDKDGIATTLGNIGNVYAAQTDYNKALEYSFRALKMKEELGNKFGIASFLGFIGYIYLNKADYPKGIEYYFKALKLHEELGNKAGIAYALSQIGAAYAETNKYSEAEKYLLDALKIAIEIGAQNDEKATEETLSDLYAKTYRHKEALEHYKKAMALKDTLFSAERNKEITRKEMNYEYDKKDAVTKAEHEAESKQQKIIIWTVIGGLLLVAVFAGFIFRSLRITRSQKVVIEKSKQIIEEKNKDIVDSINYAKRLQEAILPAAKFWNSHLPNSFVLYKPKDIVAGDFFYMDSVNGNVLFAAADCTGHGIPGCIVSVVCSNALNRAIREFRLTDPGKILSKVCELEEETFARSENAVRDGMDIALCRYNEKTKQLDYAGAHRPLWIIRNGKSEIDEIKGTKAAVGVSEGIQLFEQHSIQLSSGDTVYIFSDGYVDQFSPDDKKLMTKRFKEILLSIQDKAMEEQKAYLDSFIEDWRGSMEQTDDILVIGLKIS